MPHTIHSRETFYSICTVFCVLDFYDFHHCYIKVLWVSWGPWGPIFAMTVDCFNWCLSTDHPHRQATAFKHQMTLFMVNKKYFIYFIMTQHWQSWKKWLHDNFLSLAASVSATGTAGSINKWQTLWKSLSINYDEKFRATYMNHVIFEVRIR